MTNSGKWGRCFDDLKDDMTKCAESLLNVIKNYLNEDDEEEERTETLYDIKSFAEGIVTDAEFLINKEYDE